MAEEVKETPAPEEPVEDKEEEVEVPPIDDDDDDLPPPEEEEEIPAEEEPVAEEPVVEEPVAEETPAEEEKAEETTPYDEEAAVEEEVVEDETPDFSIYLTNVAERLWRAKEASKDVPPVTSGDLIKRSAEYQAWRKKIDVLQAYVEDYAVAMKDLDAKRTKLFAQYAVLAEGTPLYEHVGKPLTDEQLKEIDEAGDLKTMEGIETRTLTIMKVAEENGAGSLVSVQQLAAKQDELNAIDYQNHNVNQIDEWETVVISTLDKDVKELRALAKKKEHYIDKVEKLRKKINKIEKRGKKVASPKLVTQLSRNEQKLVDSDAAYDAKSHEVSVVLNEATARSWVDFYPIVKNIMKFEINQLGRHSVCYGSYHATLAALKADYKEATKGTVDYPGAGSAL